MELDWWIALFVSAKREKKKKQAIDFINWWGVLRIAKRRQKNQPLHLFSFGAQPKRKR